MILFTSHFPYLGGEAFLHHEFPFLSAKFEKITIVPSAAHSGPKADLPVNAEVYILSQNSPKPLRVLLKKYGWMLCKWFLKEFLKSPHRFNYITQFKWNWNRIIGLLQEAENWPVTWNSENKLMYSYWFNESATVMAIQRENGWKNRTIVRAHGYDYDEGQQSRGYHPFRFAELKGIDHIYQISNYGLRYMRKLYGNKPKISVHYLGVQDQLDMGPVGTSEVYTIVSCSHFYPVKRLHLIPQILKNLNVKYHWIHIGDSFQSPEIIEATSQILDKGTYEFRGWMNNESIMELYKTTPVDLFINVSELEGIPVAMMEAASFGIPLMGTNTCGVPEIVETETGLLVDVQFDTKEVANKIDAFLIEKARNIENRKKIVASFREKFEANKNFSAFADQLIN